jgi:hypothetical protein
MKQKLENCNSDTLTTEHKHSEKGRNRLLQFIHHDPVHDSVKI